LFEGHWGFVLRPVTTLLLLLLLLLLWMAARHCCSRTRTDISQISAPCSTCVSVGSYVWTDLALVFRRWIISFVCVIILKEIILWITVLRSTWASQSSTLTRFCLLCPTNDKWQMLALSYGVGKPVYMRHSTNGTCHDSVVNESIKYGQGVTTGGFKSTVGHLFYTDSHTLPDLVIQTSSHVAICPSWQFSQRTSCLY